MAFAELNPAHIHCATPNIVLLLKAAVEARAS
jgi:hypothetical protein